ncbi:conserved hypothetical protein (plasmid) [Borreliella afzelii PKo]|uniref:Uncharacterized protein n=1 Tax=Borreliella afzelii (strain PKo) TaxID=390236 RepID=Q0SKX4_BORAP|nr:hypothetical protein [Borreliella finlandensis]ABH02504.1 hypothetical protein BAPKO_6029 [Borreliella afzelii PKo]AEL70414.1 conserved hypothetical protein [Borreliella afzelii PKo]AJY73009.1 hypothetical protein BAFK78_G034 [Borreliella afzelii K78]
MKSLQHLVKCFASFFAKLLTFPRPLPTFFRVLPQLFLQFVLAVKILKGIDSTISRIFTGAMDALEGFNE